MDSLIPIDDPGDPRIRAYHGLRDHQLRMHRERTDSQLRPMCIVEGDRLIRRAIEAGFEPISLLRDPGRPAEIEPELSPSIPIFTVEPSVARSLTGMYIDRWAMACFRRPPERTFGEVIVPHTRTVLIANRVINPTNLGAMVRTAAGLGLDALILDQESCDPLYRRASRVSMGASFTFPWTRVSALPPAFARLRSHGFSVVAIETTDSAIDLHRLTPLDRVALVMGNEGTGVSDDMLDLVDFTARIPMHGSVESLNVTSAAAIACWEIMRHRS